MITVRTLLAYLLGDAAAIRRVAAHPRSLWVGLAFVLAAGFAREYDGEDLLRAPWHLVLPLVASLATSFVLYLVLHLAAFRKLEPHETRTSFLAGYRAFLALYWWTAPLALLYALPVEHMMGPGAATRINLTLLAIVATWRVVLITRATSVAWQAPFGAVLCPVMLFADGLALVLLYVAPLPVFSLMGGVRLTESESVLRNVAGTVFVLGLLCGPVWFLGSLVATRWLRRSDLPRGAPTPPGGVDPAVSKPLRALAVLVLVVWIPILPFTQPPQQRRGEVEEALLDDRLAEAVTLVRARPRSDYPPHWDPPPRPGYGEDEPDPAAVLAAALKGDAPLWFTSAYVGKVAVLDAPALAEDGKLETAEQRDRYTRIVAHLADYEHLRVLARLHHDTLRAIVVRAGRAPPAELARILDEAAK